MIPNSDNASYFRFRADNGKTTMMKLAAREDPYLFDYFIDEWSVRGAALNAVDPEDGRTLLDWIQGAYNDPTASEEVKAKRLALFRRLHRAGARTLDELVAANGVRRCRRATSPNTRPAPPSAACVRCSTYPTSILGGEHIPVDRAEGMRWWDKALERTIATRDQGGKVQIGMTYAHAYPSSRRDIPLDRDKAFEWIERAATWPPSGRKSTYPRVQVCQATSQAGSGSPRPSIRAPCARHSTTPANA
jgi:hypothetical protein